LTLSLLTVAGEPGAQESQEGGPPTAADEGQQPAAASDGGADGRSGMPPLPDYSKKLLQYVAASKGQEFMTKLQLKRPAAADDDSPTPAEQAPITFKILDEHMPLLEVRHHSYIQLPMPGKWMSCNPGVWIILGWLWHT
jgi:hypothetical protein